MHIITDFPITPLPIRVRDSQNESVKATPLSTPSSQNAVIKVLGIGGGGNNMVAHMQTQGIEGVEFICANTDVQALQKLKNCTILQLGERGFGAGAIPEEGRKAAEKERERIRSMLEGVDMIFITAGEGGGTGSGASPVFAEIAHQLGILTVAVVTKPFMFEGKKRLDVAEEGIKQLGQFVDSLITIPNDKLARVLGKQVSLLDAFKAVNNVLLGAVQGIAELITRPGLINIDFADVKTVMSEMGTSMMGTGEATGENRAKIAAKSAIANPLLEDIHLANARGVLVNITAGLNLSIGEFEEVGEVVKEFTSEGANVVIGTVIDPSMEETLRVTVVLTGLGKSSGSAVKNSDDQSSELTGESLFEQPAILRKKSGEHYQIGGNSTESHYLDVLNFVRREKTRSEDD